MVENFSNPWYLALITWLMIGLMIIGPMPKNKLPFIIQMIMVTFLAMGWPFILYMANRR